MATRFAVCCGNGEMCPHVGQRSKQHGLRWGACTHCEWERNEEATSKLLAASNAYVCLLCWLEARRVRSNADVCLCKGTSMMLARTRRQQLILAHRGGRAVPAGIPDGLRNMWNDTEALDNFPDVPPPGRGAAPLADVPPPPPDVPPPVVEAPARPVVDLMNFLEPVPFEPPAAQPPADLMNLINLQPLRASSRSTSSRSTSSQPPAADAARPAADAALPAEVTLDELGALRARCAELEARIPEQEALNIRCEYLEARVEALESDEPWQYLEHDFAERLQDIAERLRTLEWYGSSRPSWSSSD